MSSKGRCAPVADAEFYPTPAWCTRRILEALPQLTDHVFNWLEPCCGDGAITNELNKLGAVATITASDIRDISSYSLGADFVNSEYDFRKCGASQIVITNPPFSLAPELIRHFLPRCDWLILLLRASFKLGEWRHNMPDEYKLPERPEFLASEKCIGDGDTTSVNGGKGCGWSRKVALTEPKLKQCPEPACWGKVQRSTSDSSEYSWFVWPPERNRSVGLTRVLPNTSLEERHEGR
jgi:hypothetical protein